MSRRLYKYVVGLDFGPEAVRATLSRVEDGEEIESETAALAGWALGRFCDAGRQQYRLHPGDILQAMEQAVGRLAARHAAEMDGVVALGVVAPGSAALPVAADGTALGLSDEFARTPDALCFLPADGTAAPEAAEISHLCHSGKWPDYTAFTGGTCAANSFWPRVLHAARADVALRRAAAGWVELCDWIPGLLTGASGPSRIWRARYAAGRFALWHQNWGGAPQTRFLAALGLDDVPAFPPGRVLPGARAVGGLSAAWARRLGLPEAICVGIGMTEIQATAIGAGLTPGVLMRGEAADSPPLVLANAETIGSRIIPGTISQIADGILPDTVALELPPPGNFDGLAWLFDLLSWNSPERAPDIPERLDAAAAQLPPGGTGVVARDWFAKSEDGPCTGSGGATLAGLSPEASAPAIYRALVEARAFADQAMVDRLADAGVPVTRLRIVPEAGGGNALASRIAADVLGMPVDLVAPPSARTRGIAISLATATGEYRSIWEAQRAMAAPLEASCRPSPAEREAYRGLSAAKNHLMPTRIFS